MSNMKWPGPGIILKNIIRIRRMDQEPILIGGCGRTGTSLISAILDAHPEIISFPEETNIFESKRKFKSPGLNRFRNLVRFYRFLVLADIPMSSRRWCEKTPNNVRELEYIFEEFRNKVKVVLMIRDGRDVITSLHPLRKGYYITVERWIKDNAKTLGYMDHENVLIVPYESLILHFEYTMKKVLDFTGNSYDEKVKEYTRYSNVQSHEAFHGKKLKRISAKSIGRWKQEEHKARVDLLMNNQEAAAIQEQIEEYRKEFEKDA